MTILEWIDKHPSIELRITKHVIGHDSYIKFRMQDLNTLCEIIHILEVSKLNMIDAEKTNLEHYICIILDQMYSSLSNTIYLKCISS